MYYSQQQPRHVSINASLIVDMQLSWHVVYILGGDAEYVKYIEIPFDDHMS